MTNNDRQNLVLTTILLVLTVTLVACGGEDRPIVGRRIDDVQRVFLRSTDSATIIVPVDGDAEVVTNETEYRLISVNSSSMFVFIFDVAEDEPMWVETLGFPGTWYHKRVVFHLRSARDISGYSY